VVDDAESARSGPPWTSSHVFFIRCCMLEFFCNKCECFFCSKSSYEILQCIYLDMVCHVLFFLSKCNKLVLILFQKRTRDVAKVSLQILCSHIL
jgi:hypothetical protein